MLLFLLPKAVSGTQQVLQKYLLKKRTLEYNGLKRLRKLVNFILAIIFFHHYCFADFSELEKQPYTENTVDVLLEVTNKEINHLTEFLKEIA